MAEKTSPKQSMTVRSSQAPAAAASQAGALGIPGMRYRNLAIVGVVLAGVWAIAIASGSTIAMGVLGVITAALLGLGIYVWRWAKKQQDLMGLVQKGVESPEARKAAIAELEARDGANKDVMNLIARAQLEAQDDPAKALATLEQVNLKDVPSMMADEVRGFRATLYLANNKVREAREMADEIQVSRIQQPDSRGVMAATVAEAWARTGKPNEALELLETFKPEDETYAKAHVPLLFARVFANFAAGKRDLARKDLLTLCRENMEFLGRFVMPKGIPIELKKMAEDVLKRDPNVRKMAQKMGGRGGLGGGMGGRGGAPRFRR